MNLGRRSALIAVVACALLSGGFEARAGALTPQPTQAAVPVGHSWIDPGNLAAPHARLAKQANASTAAVDAAFLLHSHPGSLRTIYLDFNGYTVAPGDQWVSEGIPAGTYGGFSTDGLGS